MAGREWEEILKEQQRQRANVSRQAQDAQPVVQYLRTERDIKKNKIAAAAAQLKRIFQDLASNHPQISRFPLKDISGGNIQYARGAETYTGYPRLSIPCAILVLKWGNKFGLTSEESEWVKQNYYRPSSVRRLLGASAPDTILGMDYYDIKAQVLEGTIQTGNVASDGSFVNPSNGVSTDLFMTNPNSIAGVVASALEQPHHQYRMLVKGQDYWRDPSHKSSGGTNGRQSFGGFGIGGSIGF